MKPNETRKESLFLIIWFVVLKQWIVSKNLSEFRVKSLRKITTYSLFKFEERKLVKSKIFLC
jgi:hypothetical protein